MKQKTTASCGSCGFPISTAVANLHSCPWCQSDIGAVRNGVMFPDTNWKWILAVGVGLLAVGAMGGKKK